MVDTFPEPRSSLANADPPGNSASIAPTHNMMTTVFFIRPPLRYAPGERRDRGWTPGELDVAGRLSPLKQTVAQRVGQRPDRFVMWMMDGPRMTTNSAG